MRLASYLEACIAAIPDVETAFPALLYAEHPATDAGRVLRCLAEHPEMVRLALVFYGFAGPNGVLSAALGLRARAAKGGSVGRIFTAEAHKPRCRMGQEYLEAQGVASFVDLRCEAICIEGDQTTIDGCSQQLTKDLCPGGYLDLLAIDVQHGTPAHLYRSLLGTCAPRVLLVENSGLRWWRYSARVQLETDNPWLQDQGRQSTAPSRATAGAAEHWYAFEEEHLYAPSAAGKGPFRLAVDRQPSGMLTDRSWDPDPVRLFSVYVAAT